MLIYSSQTGKVTTGDIRVPAEDEVAWIRLLSPTPEEVNRVLGDMFHSHPLLIEDCIKLKQRPKLDRYKNNIFLTFYAIRKKELSMQEIGIIVGSNYVITVCENDIPFMDEVYRQFSEIEGRLDDPGDILYQILDHCVDEYSQSIDLIENQIERYERNLYRNPNIRVAHDIFKLKRTLHQLRRIIVEEKTILSLVSHQNLPYTRQENDVYFIDIYDHISRVIDSIDIFREALSSLLELQMSMKSDRMNEIMKTLTVFSTIFMPLTFIVGLYGMNFKTIPEFNWPHGYQYVWGLIIVVTLAMMLFFKRKKWW
jgi:magnesium transporter